MYRAPLRHVNRCVHTHRQTENPRGNGCLIYLSGIIDRHIGPREDASTYFTVIGRRLGKKHGINFSRRMDIVACDRIYFYGMTDRLPFDFPSRRATFASRRSTRRIDCYLRSFTAMRRGISRTAEETVKLALHIHFLNSLSYKLTISCRGSYSFARHWNYQMGQIDLSFGHPIVGHPVDLSSVKMIFRHFFLHQHSAFLYSLILRNCYLFKEIRDYMSAWIYNSCNFSHTRLNFLPISLSHTFVT